MWCVFFFKQKTAYEMRISDWSSDVCSSDLIDLLPQVQASGWGRRLLDTLFAALRDDRSSGVHWGVSTRNEHAIGFYRHLGCEELSVDPKLGRASCRARVCKYV